MQAARIEPRLSAYKSGVLTPDLTGAEVEARSDYGPCNVRGFFKAIFLDNDGEVHFITLTY